MIKASLNFLFLLGFFTLSACAVKKADNLLILPPEFEVMPDLNKKDQDSNKSKSKDIEQLKDLLLKKQR